MVSKCIYIQQVPREVLKTAASGTIVNAWKTMFDPYNDKANSTHVITHVTGKNCNSGTVSRETTLGFNKF